MRFPAFLQEKTLGAAKGGSATSHLSAAASSSSSSHPGHCSLQGIIEVGEELQDEVRPPDRLQ